MPTEKLLSLAELLRRTSRMHFEHAAVLREHGLDEIAEGMQSIGAQIEITARRIEQGEYDDQQSAGAPLRWRIDGWLYDRSRLYRKLVVVPRTRRTLR